MASLWVRRLFFCLTILFGRAVEFAFERLIILPSTAFFNWIEGEQQPWLEARRMSDFWGAPDFWQGWPE